MTRRRAIDGLIVATVAWAATACSPGGFASPSKADSVRIFASSADPPYAKPGDTVSMQVLAVDERPVKAAPMTLYWFPQACINPPNDAYYACFARFAGGGRAPTDGGAGSGPDGAGSAGDGGAGSAGASGPGSAGDSGAGLAAGGGGAPVGALQPGTDLRTVLPTGPSFQFDMPADIVKTHEPTPGTTPYGLAIVFNIACAGRVETVALDPGNLQEPPVGCFDANHTRLGPSDYVIGYSRVYAYDQLSNANPVIDHIDVDGNPVDLVQGLEIAPCTASACTDVHIGPVVPASSQEVNPLEKDPNGNPLKEEIWADFYSNLGVLKDDSRLLYNPSAGSAGPPSDTDTQFHPPGDPGDGFIWIVVHDNRGGAAWVTVPVHVH